LGVGVAANASFIAAANGLPATAVWLRSAYQIDNGGLGLLLGALGIGAALSELPWGAAADRWAIVASCCMGSAPPLSYWP
jgi:hypothetical protein